MGNVRYFYFEKIVKQKLLRPWEILMINEDTGERENMTYPDKNTTFSKIHRIPGGTYIADEGCILKDIEKSTANYIVSIEKAKSSGLKTRKIRKDLEGIANLKLRGIK
jgi:hypothetical protein